MAPIRSSGRRCRGRTRGRRCAGGRSTRATSRCRACCTGGSSGARTPRRASSPSTPPPRPPARRRRRPHACRRAAERDADGAAGADGRGDGGGAVLATQPVLARRPRALPGRAGGRDRGGDAGGRRAGGRARARRVRGAAGRLRPAGGARSRARRTFTMAGTSCAAGTFASGDVDEGFRRADVVVEHTYRTPFVDHAYMETETGVGWIDAEGVVVAAREHPGAGALPRRRRRAGAPAQPRAARGRVPGRRVRREGRRHRRVPARPPRLEDAAPGSARVLARGVVHRPRQAPSVRDALPDGRHPRRESSRRSTPSSPPTRAPTPRCRRGSCSTAW